IRAARFCENRIKFRIAGTMIFRLQTIHINEAGTNRQHSATAADREAFGRLAAHDAMPEEVNRLRAPPPTEDPVPFVPFRIQLDAALLHQDAAEVVRGIKTLPADV